MSQILTQNKKPLNTHLLTSMILFFLIFRHRIWSYTHENAHVQTTLPIRWYKEGGSLSSRAYQQQYTLYIRNIQIDDSGVYVCEATKDGETVSQKVTVTVGGE